MNLDEAKAKFPLTVAFVDRYTLAVQVETGREVNDGLPKVTAYIVDRTLDDPKAMLESRRPIVELLYHAPDDPSKPIRFFDPEGNVSFVLNDGDAGTVKDADVNPRINALWNLEPDSPFARKIGEAIASILSMLTAAHLIAQGTGRKVMEVFDAIQRANFDPGDAAMFDATDGTPRDKDGNPVTSLKAAGFDRTDEAKQEEPANEG